MKKHAPKSLWPTKVLALVQSGQIEAAIEQIKVAPSVKDLQALQLAWQQLQASRRVPPHPRLHQTLVDALAAMSAPRLHRSP
jgi:hypothetical protein